MIYAIQAGEGGPIKIGRASDPSSRMAELQTGNPERLRLIANVCWPPEIEKCLHKFLDHHRLVGEWFRASEEVLWVVEKMHDEDAAHEIFFRYQPASYFPWMSAEDEPLSREFMSDFEARLQKPAEIVSAGIKWPGDQMTQAG